MKKKVCTVASLLDLDQSFHLTQLLYWATLEVIFRLSEVEIQKMNSIKQTCIKLIIFVAMSAASSCVLASGKLRLRISRGTSSDFTASSWGIKEIIEMVRAKTNKMTCAPSKDSDQPGQPPVWWKSSLCILWVAKDPVLVYGDSEDSDQTGRMPRLIRVFAGCTDHFVGFVVLWFKYAWKVLYSR